MRIVFFGTPDFAVATLAAVVENGFDVVGVVTAPDKPAGRGLQPKMSAVKQYALDHHLNLAQPEKLRNPEFIAWLKACQADLQVVVAFRMLPEVVWNMPALGTYNVHASLLPQYRGAAPINWAIMNGERETGVTVFKLQHEIDTGPVLAKKTMLIDESDNAGTLHDKLMLLGAKTMVEVLIAIKAGTATPIAQSDMLGQNEPLKKAPKIFTGTCFINFDRNALLIVNQIRGLSPYPGAFMLLNGRKLKVFAAKAGEPINKAAGTLDTDGKSYLRVAAEDRWIQLLDVQLEGKKRLTIEEFLRGYRFES